MLVNGPLPISTNEQVGKTDLTFRPYQRVVAAVLQVTANQAILMVDGTTIVARLTSPEQAEMLKDQRQARFIVTQASENTINLKLMLPNSASQTEITGVQQDMLTHFLTALSLPTTDQNMTLLQSMLKNQLPINTELFNELAATLLQSGNVDANAADMAAAIKAAGLPLTPESLISALKTNGLGIENLENLMKMLKDISDRSQLPADFRLLIESAIDLLGETQSSAAAPRAELAKALENQVILNGRSLENVLIEQTENKPFWPDKSLTLFSRLQVLAENQGEHGLSNEITKYLNQVHQSQFWNIQSGQSLKPENWLEIPIFVQMPGNNGQEKGEQARFRILRNRQGSESGIDAANTRLVIEMEVSPGKTVQVGLSLAGKQAWSDVIASDEQILEYARKELPSLEEGMQSLGFALLQNNLRVGKPVSRSTTPHNGASARINLEV